MKKKFSALVLVVLLICSVSTSVFADTWTYSYHWVLTSTEYVGTETRGNWELKYSGYPSSTDGEYDTISFSESYSHTFTGSFEFNIIKEEVEAQLGYSYGVSQTFGVAKNSRVLAKGEYVKAYSIKNYKKTKVTQSEWLMKYFGPRPTTIYDDPTGVTSIVYSYQAIMPQLKLEYWKNGIQVSSVNAKSASTEPYMVEYYEADAQGNYNLVNTEYNR